MSTYNNFEYYERTIWKFDKYRILRMYKLLEREEPGKILDLGCLAGRDMLHLLKTGWDCYGIEISPRACAEATKRGIKAVQYDLNKGIPFNDEFFDAVWAAEIIEHLMDTDSLLSECHRILRNDGVLLITTPNLASLLNRVRLFFGKYPRYVQYSMRGPGHVRYYTVQVLEKQILLHCFIIEKITSNFLSFPDPFPGKPLRNTIFSYLGKLLPTLSENIIIKARKPRSKRDRNLTTHFCQLDD